MSTILSIYLIVGLCIVFVPMLLKCSLKVTFYILFIPLIPFVPFVVAYNIRKEKPALSKTLFILYGLLYFILTTLLVFLYFCVPGAF